jgi:release factor glutamine methyltransferase
VTVEEFLDDIRRRLSPFSETPGLDAQVLVAHILKQTRTWVLAHPQASLKAEQANQLETALRRLENGEPLPYVLGHWEFYGLDFQITPDVLIPRPETELLVEQAILWLNVRGGTAQNTGSRAVQRPPLWAVDVGTGSGCIGIALAKNIPDLRVIATDISLPALRVAQTNAWNLGVDEHVSFVQSDLLSPFARLVSKIDSKISEVPPFDLVCANLPYISDETLDELKVSRSEPRLALSGGEDGLQLIRRLLWSLSVFLAPSGAALLEIEATQGPSVRSLAQKAHPNAKVEIIKDLAGLDRVVYFQLG